MADDREQIVWQLRAALVYADLLREQLKGDLLPVLRWTVQSAGCLLFGEPPARGDAEKSAAVQAWADRLGLEVRRTPMSDGWTRLTAHGKYERVEVAISTTLYGEEGEVAEHA